MIDRPTQTDSPPPSTTYASVAAMHTPRQAQPRRQPSTSRVKPTTAKLLNPVRIVVQLNHEPTLPVRDLPPPVLFRQLSDLCAKVTNAPAPLGAHWNRKLNLIIAFPAGTTRTSIKTLFPSICSLIGSKNKPTIRFDVPWCKVHLAGIRARDSLDLPITSEEELRQTLQRNPAIQALNITVHATWLKKPDNIASTHTSAIIAFEDPDGSIERTLLKSTIFAFGETVTLKKWHERPWLKSH
ncbi:hypothetical protein RSOL_079830, partial [Rhizoctonia solani AG-3 Rhs1AP]